MRKKILEYRRRLAQRYANFIIKQLEININSDLLFNFWISQGYILNQKMIAKYEIYLD